MRRLDADEIYFEALKGIDKVEYCLSTVIEKYADADALVAAAGDRLVGAITAAIDARGVAYVVLTGGGTGVKLLKHVGEHGEAIDWSKVHLFWGDDRYVPADDDDRNDKQAREALLDHIDIPAANVHAMPASDGEFGDDIDAAALAYEQVLAANAAGRRARPPISTCTCSAWAVKATSTRCSRTPRRSARRTAWSSASTDSPKPPPRRITLTLPAVQRSREVWLVVAGAEKADAVAAAVGGAAADDVPAAGAVGRDATVWLLDEAAAADL